MNYPSGAIARRIPDATAGGDTGFSWLPDSRRLVIAEYAGPQHFKMAVVETSGDSRKVIYASHLAMLDPSVSPDGKRIAFASGTVEWNVLEVTVASGSVHTALGGGGESWWPDWAPNGTHYLVSRDRGGTGLHIEDVSPDGFSRLVAAPTATQTMAPRWSPDGTRLVFTASGSQGLSLMLLNAAGGQAVEIMKVSGAQSASWSPDGQWIVTLKKVDGKLKVVKVKPAAGATPVVLAAAAPQVRQFGSAEWSPGGNWILYQSGQGMALVSPDGAINRELTPHKYHAYAFSKDGRHVFGIFHNTSGMGAQFQLYTVDVATGAEKLVAPVDLPASANSLVGFSLHPDGKRFLTSIAKLPYHILMLEGFDQPPSRNWLDRLFRH